MNFYLNIDINNDQDIYELRTAMKAIVRNAIFKALAFEHFDRDTEVSVTFTDNEGIKELNKTYRNKDSFTDVLSFPMFDDLTNVDMGDEPIPLGDIVISLERAYAQSREIGHSIYRELAFLAVHSTLHLLGYDHETSEEDEKNMFDKQKKIMEIMGF